MTCVGYYHAMILSPTAYARHMYPTNINEDSNYWKHEDAARHMANQLMNKFSKLTVLGSPSPDMLPADLWKDPVRITATLFSQASRIVILVPSDCSEHITSFTAQCLGPLLTKSKNEGGRSEWHSRFVAAAIGSVPVPMQLSPEIPFVKTIRFREIAWFRDISALMLMERAIKDFWVPNITPPPNDSKDQTDMGTSRIGRIYGPLISKAGYSLDECVETTSVIGFSTHVSGKLDLPEDLDAKLTGKSNASSPDRLRSRKSRSRSSTRHSTRSRSRLLKPEFEAREAEQSELKTMIKGNVGEVVLLRLSREEQKRLENGSAKPIRNGLHEKPTNGFHDSAKSGDHSAEIKSPVSVDNGTKPVWDKVKDYIDELETPTVEKPITATHIPIIRHTVMESPREPSGLLSSNGEATKTEAARNGRTSPRVYRSGRGSPGKDLKAPLASTSNDDEDIHVAKPETEKLPDTTDSKTLESPRTRSQTSYVKRVITREQTYSSYTTTERTEGKRSPVGSVDPNTPAPNATRQPTPTPVSTTSTSRPASRSTSPQEKPLSPLIEKNSTKPLVTSVPVRVETSAQDPVRPKAVPETPAKQPVRIITARRVYTDQPDAPILRPATPPTTKQFTRTISVKSLSTTRTLDEPSTSAPRSVSTSDIYTAPLPTPTTSATPSTSTAHVIKARQISPVEPRHPKLVCDSQTHIISPLIFDKSPPTNVECYADRGVIYTKSNQPSKSTGYAINKDVCLWTGPDSSELYRLELMLNSPTIRVARSSKVAKAADFVDTVEKVHSLAQQAEPDTRICSDSVTEPGENNLWRIMMIYLTAFLTVLLSLIIAYLFLGNSNCD